MTCDNCINLVKTPFGVQCKISCEIAGESKCDFYLTKDYYMNGAIPQDQSLHFANYLTTSFIKDSGDRTEFPSGAVRDLGSGKGRYDLLPWDAIHELALHCEEGARKYGERNVNRGIPTHSLLDSATRHISCYLRGMKDEPHLRAAMWNIAWAIWMEINRSDMQDIPERGEEEAQ